MVARRKNAGIGIPIPCTILPTKLFLDNSKFRQYFLKNSMIANFKPESDTYAK